MNAKTLSLTILPLLACAVLSMGGGCAGPVDPAAEKTLHSKLGNTTITIFPAFLRTGGKAQYAPEAAPTIAAMFESGNLATPTVSTAEVPMRGKPGFNQSKMFREGVEDLTDYVQANPIATEYALLPEYLISSAGGVGGVHVYVVDAEGRCAYGLGLNSHHAPFQKANPKSVADCTQLVIDVMRTELKPSAK